MRESILASVTCLLILALSTSILADQTPTSATKWRISNKDSPGVALWLVETGRQTLGDGTPEVTYSVHTSGFPQGKTYSMWINRVAEEPFKIVNKMFVDDTREMIVSEFREDTDVPWLPAPLTEVLPITLDHFQPAEPIRLEIMADDRTVEGHAIEFPLPIEDKDGSCHLYLEMVDRDRLAFAAWGQGFAPNETVMTESRSGMELVKSSLDVAAAGRFINMLLPQTEGKKQGTASYSVFAQSCSVHVEYEWGKSKKK